MSQVLTFDEASHSYRLDGELIPGVTSVLAPLSSYGDVPREILDAAARRGTHVHRAVELIAQDRLDWNTVDEDHYGYLEAFMTFCDRMKPEFIANEKRTFHPVLKYAGTLDMELVLHGKPKAKLAVLDVKSCVTVMPTTGPQTAAYLAAENAHRPVKRDHIVERYGLRLGKDGTFELIPYTAASDLHDFNACLRLYRFQQLHHKFYKQLAA